MVDLQVTHQNDDEDDGTWSSSDAVSSTVRHQWSLGVVSAPPPSLSLSAGKVHSHYFIVFSVMQHHSA